MTYETAIGYLQVVSLTTNDCWCIGVFEFAANDLAGILYPQDFPLLYLEVLEFVTRVEN